MIDLLLRFPDDLAQDYLLTHCEIFNISAWHEYNEV